jgi:hypothetical protein
MMIAPMSYKKSTNYCRKNFCVEEIRAKKIMIWRIKIASDFVHISKTFVEKVATSLKHFATFLEEVVTSTR